MNKRIKIVVAVAALTAMTSAAPAFAGGKGDCSSIWNLLVLAKRCA